MSTFLVSENWRRLQALKERKNRAGLGVLQGHGRGSL